MDNVEILPDTAKTPATPDAYGVVGHPISHSRSPFIHGLFARQTQQALVYRSYDVTAEALDTFVREFFEQGKGLNITMPHKQAAAGLAGALTPRAARAGAVNTLSKSGQMIVGDNTDGAGLVRDLSFNLGITVQQSSVLILGAGGATRGILAPLLALRPRSVVIANRTPEHAQELARHFADLGAVRGCGFDGIARTPVDLIINATSTALTGQRLPLDPRVVGPDTVCYDMMYGQGETPFTIWAELQGCARTVKGWGMLVEQAAESFQLWRGMRPDTTAVLAILMSQQRLNAW